MAIHDLTGWQHSHAYDAGNRGAERRTWLVVAITAATMVAEIVAGLITGSMALLADGWHMATHVVALSIAGVAYLLARRWSRDERFAFGTWKIEVLGAFSSALLLGVVAIAMIVESSARLVSPTTIDFGPALVVAVVGLAVNLASAVVLGHGNEKHAHHDDHDDHHHDHAHHHDDLNLKSAYVHVVADAFTSVLAIAALSSGLWLGWSWLDPVMAIVGAGVILWWAKGLLADSARVLLDREMDSPIVVEIRKAIQSDGDAEIADLHVWRVGRASHAAVVTIVAERPLAPDAYRARLAGIASLMHVSVEVNQCPHLDCT
ncbi:MAG TPA: CDF family Co(II)/Ni(II) efflux transporter DmeF [Usitatibacter sp.]|nr:CDF family Co(II)/Ni(II) efflux transporter DmeF [Usitatibacter sp.]